MAIYQSGLSTRKDRQQKARIRMGSDNPLYQRRKTRASDILRRLWQHGGGWPAALLFTLLCHALFQVATLLCFAVSLSLAALGRDMIAHLLLGALFYALARSPAWFMTALVSLLALLHCGNAAKVAILGGPAMPDDLLALPNFFLLLQGWPLWLAAAIGAGVAFSLLGLPDPRKKQAWLAGLLMACATFAFLRWPAAISVRLDNTFGNSVWDQRGNFEARGILLHLTQESARFLARAGHPPTQGQVEKAAALLNAQPARPVIGVQQKTPPPSQRNLHIIILESFWDPLPLTKAGLSADPLDPRFRALWQETGNPQALSPVFGGYTANAEFEALCGFPVIDDAVFFEGRLRHEAPCLPRHLGEAGYVTMASHPNVAAFWNRVLAYRRMGFAHYLSLNDFEKDDMNGDFLSDASLYRQVLTRLTPLREQGIPVLNYILTFFGHLDYPLSPNRPKAIFTANGDQVIEAYANTVYYKSRELMDFLETLRSLDPDGLIVIFGDHLPFLGNNFGGYSESGLLAPERGDFSDSMFRTLTATPLLVINGTEGPLSPVAPLPLYRLPDLILTLLGDDRPSNLTITRTPPGVSIRPLPGMLLVAHGSETATCRATANDPEWCGEIAVWLDAVETLAHDTFSGQAHFLSPPPRQETTTSL